MLKVKEYLTTVLGVRVRKPEWKQLIFNRNITKPFSLQTNVTNAVKLLACLHLVLVLVLCCLSISSSSLFTRKHWKSRCKYE